MARFPQVRQKVYTSLVRRATLEILGLRIGPVEQKLLPVDALLEQVVMVRVAQSCVNGLAAP